MGETMATYSYDHAMAKLRSGQPARLDELAAHWGRLAALLRGAADVLDTAASRVGARQAEPYQLFQARVGQLGSWLRDVDGNAQDVSAGLRNAAEVGRRAQAVMREEEGVSDLHTLSRLADPVTGTLSLLSPVAALPAAAGAFVLRQLDSGVTGRLNKQIDSWARAFDAIRPRPVPPVPTRGSVTVTGPAGATRPHRHRTATGQPGVPAPAAAPPLVVGPAGGDFAGWVRDPRTGFLLNPATGQEFDPLSQRWVDPVTGRPFGSVVTQVTRLEGVTPGLVTRSDLGTLFGGTLPPSLEPANPAADQLRAQALDTMAVRAYMARHLAGSGAAPGAGDASPTRSGAGHSGPANRAGYPQPAAGEPTGRERRRRRPDWLTADAEVWTAGLAGSPPVLGEGDIVAGRDPRG
jgi:hypothetical protein